MFGLSPLLGTFSYNRDEQRGKSRYGESSLSGTNKKLIKSLNEHATPDAQISRMTL